MQAAIMTACIAAQITQPHLVLLTNVGRRPLGFWLYLHPLITWGEWAIAMHGRYESHILFISITCVYYIHTMILLYFSTIYFILDILYMNINRSTTPAGQLWFVCLILLYVTYNKYFYLTSTMTHFYAYYLRINCKIEFD
jgi:hypothetical protein